MKVGVIQSSFIPWRGYFDFIESVDIFVFLDDVQYSKNSWRNRNRIKTADGLQWLTVPIRQERLGQLIDETLIDNSQNWATKHFSSWKTNYAKAPYFSTVIALLEGLGDKQQETISHLNIKLIKRICEYLNITTTLLISSELSLTGSKTDRLINLLKKLDATTYLSGPSADAYLDKNAFLYNNIRLEYKSYDYEPYPQLWGSYEGNVTILDLIAHMGPSSAKLLASRTENIVVIG